MSNWKNRPPTEQEWLDANNEGYWWLRISVGSCVQENLVWPAFNLYEIVKITKEILDGNGNRTNRLCFHCNISGKQDTIYCDDLPDHVKEYQWKPVDPHGDKN